MNELVQLIACQGHVSSLKYQNHEGFIDCPHMLSVAIDSETDFNE